MTMDMVKMGNCSDSTSNQPNTLARSAETKLCCISMSVDSNADSTDKKTFEDRVNIVGSVKSLENTETEKYTTELDTTNQNVSTKQTILSVDEEIMNTKLTDAITGAEVNNHDGEDNLMHSISDDDDKTGTLQNHCLETENALTTLIKEGENIDFDDNSSELKLVTASNSIIESVVNSNDPDSTEDVFQTLFQETHDDADSCRSLENTLKYESKKENRHQTLNSLPEYDVVEKDSNNVQNNHLTDDKSSLSDSSSDTESLIITNNIVVTKFSPFAYLLEKEPGNSGRFDHSDGIGEGSTESVFADDEYDSTHELYTCKRYTSENNDATVLVKCSFFGNSMEKSSSDEMFAERQKANCSNDSALDDSNKQLHLARNQMMDIHEHLCNLRRQLSAIDESCSLDNSL